MVGSLDCLSLNEGSRVLHKYSTAPYSFKDSWMYFLRSINTGAVTVVPCSGVLCCVLSSDLAKGKVRAGSIFITTTN